MHARVFLIVIVLLSSLLTSCEDTNVGLMSGEGDLLPYLTSMNRVSVSFTAYTRHYRYEKQTSFDPGTSSHFPGERNYWFTNEDSTFVLEWLDSGFTSKCVFGVRQYSPYPMEYIYPIANSSTIAGFYDPVARTLRDVRCVFKFTESTGPADYQFANASLAINEMECGVIAEDSVEFIATGSRLRSVVSLGYSAEEYRYGGGYTKKSKLDSIMWDELSVIPTLRVVFYR